MGADIWSFKEYKFIPEYGDYRLEIIGEKALIYGVSIHSKFDDLLEEQGICGWFGLIPYLNDYNFDALDERQKVAFEEWIFDQPQKGIAFIKEWNVLEIIETHLPGNLEYIQSLYAYWSEGYYLFFDY